MKKKICIVGTGGFSREVLCLLTDLGEYDNVDAFMEPEFLFKDMDQNQLIMGKPIISMNSFNPSTQTAVVGTGDSQIRQKVVEKQLPKETEYPTIIHPNAIVSRWAEIGRGSIICAGTIITSQIKIGDFAQLNLGTTIGHDCKIDDYFTTAPGANISGICNIGKHVYFGTSAATRQGVNICDNVLIGMGAMVIKNIKEEGTYIGTPAKKFKI
jgi:sugar O-acyltransferase (sialic acid O-acetyltransferase NeuD family)